MINHDLLLDRLSRSLAITLYGYR